MRVLTWCTSVLIITLYAAVLAYWLSSTQVLPMRVLGIVITLLSACSTFIILCKSGMYDSIAFTAYVMRQNFLTQGNNNVRKPAGKPVHKGIFPVAGSAAQGSDRLESEGRCK